MSDHRIEDLPLSSSSRKMPSSRPQHQEKPAQQEGRLALLPVEVLLNITGEPGKDEQTLSHKDFKSLALSSGVFFRELRQAYYYADNFAAFHSALRYADMETIERCYQLAKPPLHLEWEVSCQCPSDKAHKHHRPIDDVLECIAIGSVSIYRCIETIRWLLSKGYEANEQKEQVWYKNNQHCDHMPELVIDLLGKTSDKARVEGICKIITMLHDHGYSLPYHINLSQVFHLMAADIFDKKIHLLIDYHFVELQEIQVLRRLVKFLRETPLDFDLIDEVHDGKEYWEKLCATLGPLMKNEDLVRNDLRLGWDVLPTPRRLHRFIIEADWNPWTVWHDYKMQNPKHRANLSHPWMKFYRWRLIQRRNGMWYDPEWHIQAELEKDTDAESGFKRPKHSLPHWNAVDYDEFVATVERLWLEENSPNNEQEL
ncbi:uncharacterized protein FFC1_02089 [Fusarium fujikuroi]|nr:uncharacterized protein FFC1_02089 [Fusarium fujikuroi]